MSNDHLIYLTCLTHTFIIAIFYFRHIGVTGNLFPIVFNCIAMCPPSNNKIVDNVWAEKE